MGVLSASWRSGCAWCGTTVGRSGSGTRWCGAIGVIEILMTFGVVACIASLVSARGRRLGDVFAGTLVVRERVSVGQTAFVPPPPPWLTGRFAELDLSAVPDGLWLAIRQYLTRMQQLDPQVGWAMAERLAADLVARTGAPAPQGAAYRVSGGGGAGTAGEGGAAGLRERRARSGQRVRARGGCAGCLRPLGAPAVASAAAVRRHSPVWRAPAAAAETGQTAPNPEPPAPAPQNPAPAEPRSSTGFAPPA